MHVVVKQEHIDQARKNYSAGSIASISCPIALALQEQLNERWGYSDRGALSSWVGYTGCRIGTELYWLPSEATEFINSFDDDKQVQPFEFDITPRSESLV